MIPDFWFRRGLLLFFGTTFLRSSVVPASLSSPGFHREGDDSVSFLFFPVVSGSCSIFLKGVAKACYRIEVLGPQIFPWVQGSFCLHYLSFDQVWVI